MHIMNKMKTYIITLHNLKHPDDQIKTHFVIIKNHSHVNLQFVPIIERNHMIFYVKYFMMKKKIIDYS
jgi:hypothetical protein